MRKLMHTPSFYRLCIQTSSRLFCTEASVRVRFAPSPTGHLHLGGLRTAFYNYLFAKQRNGKFILRIEDTDKSRIVPEAYDDIESTLEWAGIPPDESPTRGGDYGPYIQSMRSDLYKYYASELLESGAAYRCFCTEYRLQLMKKEALRNRQSPRYDNRCRRLTTKNIEARLNQQMPFTIRFKLPEEPVTFTDTVYGEITQRITEESGDFIILKSDEMPTYHLASVVDDHLMEISHVLRGYEWLASAGKHIRLYEAFGWQPPELIHLPLILNKDGGKLSKRDGDISLSHLTESGYYPISIFNFLTLIGGGFTDTHTRSNQLLDKDELVDRFRVEKIVDHSARLDLQRLDDFNRHQLSDMVTRSDESRAELVKSTRKLLTSKYGEGVESSHLTDDYIGKVLRWCVGRVSRLPELTSDLYHYIWVRPTDSNLQFVVKQQRKLRIHSLPEALKRFITLFEETADVNFTKIYLNDALIQMGRETKPHRNYIALLRAVLTSLQSGPPVAEMLEILGKEESIARVRHFYDIACTLEREFGTSTTSVESSH